MSRGSNKSHAVSVVERAVSNARKKLGAGWGHVSPEIRRGLVDSQLMSVIMTDIDMSSYETMTAAEILEYVRELAVTTDLFLMIESQEVKS